MNCAVKYIDREEDPKKELKTLIGQAYQRDTNQTAQECVGRYPRSKLGTTRVVNRAVLRGTDKRQTGK